jgi:hypothetical protein
MNDLQIRIALTEQIKSAATDRERQLLQIIKALFEKLSNS